jgi:peroxiredoxin
MSKVVLDRPAPTFELKNYQGESVKLSDFRSQKNVLLVFNRGFT